jgi:hypothetical protein
MLYVPASPYQFIEQNPERYGSPNDRDMKYEEIWLKASDGIKLQGWFMF